MSRCIYQIFKMKVYGDEKCDRKLEIMKKEKNTNTPSRHLKLWIPARNFSGEEIFNFNAFLHANEGNKKVEKNT